MLTCRRQGLSGWHDISISARSTSRTASVFLMVKLTVGHRDRANGANPGPPDDLDAADVLDLNAGPG
jgi:hypothetical protein